MAGCILGLSCPCPHLLQQLCQVLSAGGHFLVQLLDGLLGSAKLLQTLLLPGLGGSQLLLQPSQAVPQALALLLLCPQLQRRQRVSGCCIAVLVPLPARARSVPSLLLPIPAHCPLLQHRLCCRDLFSLLRVLIRSFACCSSC